MKRIGGLLEATASLVNLDYALHDSLKHRNKHNALSADAERFLSAKEDNLFLLRNDILNGIPGEFQYRTFTHKEHDKLRKIDWNPCFRDNVMQHALFNTVGKALERTFIPDTYSGIKHRGAEYGRIRICRFMQSFLPGTDIYALKGDIRHYYPSIDTRRLNYVLEHKIKDKTLLQILQGIVDSHPDGLPIGNYLSQLLANLYLSEFDHWVVEKLGLLTYARYCDDIVALGAGRKSLANNLCSMRSYLNDMGLELKHDAQVFPIERGGLDFMGFVFHRGGTTTLRKRIERSFRRAALEFTAHPCEKTYQSLASYKGWAKALTRGQDLWDAVVGLDLKTCLAITKAA